MPPRNLLLSMFLGALTTLLHPFAFAAKAASAAASSLGRAARRFFDSRASRSESDSVQWTPELLKRLEWRRFEELCAAYFEALGFRADLAGAGADVAINLYKQDSKNAAIIVQCQPWNAHHVGIKPVRELRGAMTSGNVGEGVLVTSGKFTQGSARLRRQGGRQPDRRHRPGRQARRAGAATGARALQARDPGRLPDPHLPVLRDQDDLAQEHRARPAVLGLPQLSRLQAHLLRGPLAEKRSRPKAASR